MQVLHLAVVHRIAVAAVGVEHQRAQRRSRAVVDGIGLEAALVGILVQDAHRTRSRQLAGRHIGIFRQRRDARAQCGNVVRALDGDHDIGLGAIGRGHFTRVGQRLARAQRLHRSQAVVQRIGPVAVLVDAEGAVVAGDVGLHHEHRLACIGIDHIELAARGQRDVFSHGTLIGIRRGRADHGTRIRALDADDDGAGGRAIEAGDRIGLHHRLAILQIGHLAVVHRVAVRAIGIEREGTQGGIGRQDRAFHLGQDRARLELGFACVHIGNGQRADGGQHAAGSIGILGEGAVRLAQLRLVIGAGDRHRDLCQRAIDRAHRDGFRQRLAFAQLLDDRVVVVQAVVPVAIVGDGELAVLNRNVALLNEVGLTGIDIGHIQLAAGVGLGIFLQHRGVVAGDDCAIVGALDGDGDVLGRGCALVIRHAHGDGIRHGIAGAQLLHLGAGVVQHIGPFAVGIYRQASILALAAVVDAPGVCVAHIHIGLGQIAVDAGLDVFRDGTSGGAADRGRIVGAIDGDLHRRGRQTVQAGDGICLQHLVASL